MRRHGLLHGDDLCLAANHRALGKSLGGAGLFVPGTRNRRPTAGSADPYFRLFELVDRSSGIGSTGNRRRYQVFVLEVDHHNEQHEYGVERYRTWPTGAGPHA